MNTSYGDLIYGTLPLAAKMETGSTEHVWLQRDGLLTRVGCIRVRQSWCPRHMSANRYQKDSTLPMPPPQEWHHALWLYTGRVCSAAVRETQKRQKSGGIKRATLGAEGENEVYECKRPRKRENRQSEHIKSYPWNWQHICLLSRTLMLIW